MICPNCNTSTRTDSSGANIEQIGRTPKGRSLWRCTACGAVLEKSLFGRFKQASEAQHLFINSALGLPRMVENDEAPISLDRLQRNLPLFSDDGLEGVRKLIRLMPESVDRSEATRLLEDEVQKRS